MSSSCPVPAHLLWQSTLHPVLLEGFIKGRLLTSGTPNGPGDPVFALSDSPMHCPAPPPPPLVLLCSVWCVWQVSRTVHFFSGKGQPWVQSFKYPLGIYSLPLRGRLRMTCPFEVRGCVVPSPEVASQNSCRGFSTHRCPGPPSGGSSLEGLRFSTGTRFYFLSFTVILMC